MKWQWSLLSLVLLVPAAVAEEPLVQDPLKAAPAPAAPAPLAEEIGNSRPGGACSNLFANGGPARSSGGCLDGTHNFDRFIGFMSNPLFNIDPRAVTELIPITGWNWFDTTPALPSGDMWLVPGAALTVALSERLAVGINQGGYATASLSRNDPGLFVDRFGRVRNRLEFSGDDREGWLNLGGFGQYTVIEDVPNQFLLTTGLRWEAPIGSKDIFQGHGPAHLAPYLTAGKEFGCFHVLADLGFDFPTGSGDSNFFYGSVHFDRQFFGWLYPVLEFNWVYHTDHVDADLVTRRGFINFGNFESTGNLVSMAVGADAVLIPAKLEAGAVYTTDLGAQHGFGFNGPLLKMVLRY
jgi:hypothetical protein